MRYFYSLFIFLLLIHSGCSFNGKITVDMTVINAKIYTVNDKFETAEALAVNNGRIIAVGSNAEISKKYAGKEQVDAASKPLYPGFIDAHAHFYRYGIGLQTADLVGTKSWDEILEKVSAFSKESGVENGQNSQKTWLFGRGWDQNDWDIKEYPNKKRLDELFPDRPVLLTRVDGHGAIINQAAINQVGIQPNQKIKGGEIETKNGQLTGILIDNAIDLVTSKIPKVDTTQMRLALLEAQTNCFAVGLTTVVDRGLNDPTLIILKN